MMKRIQHGFTLIELLVVIAIISLLVSILLPSLSTARNLAKKVACSSNMKQIGTAIYLYADEFNGILPAKYTIDVGAWNIPTGRSGGILEPTAYESDIFVCPANEFLYAGYFKLNYVYNSYASLQSITSSGTALSDKILVADGWFEQEPFLFAFPQGGAVSTYGFDEMHWESIQAIHNEQSNTLRGDGHVDSTDTDRIEENKNNWVLWN